MEETDLAELLYVSRRNNEALGVTGLLIYAAGSFLQVLEGDDGAVEHVMSRVHRDPRHKGVIVLIDAKISAREFGNWSMGFRSSSASEIDKMTGYQDFFKTPQSADQRVTVAQTVLRTFIRSNDRG